MGVRSIWMRLRAMGDRAGAAFDSLVDKRISLLVGSAFIVIGVGQVTGPIHVRLAFYGAVAQVIPVLMVAVTVEGRYFREREGDPPFDRFIQRGFWFAGLVGIGASLASLARGADSVLLRGAVIYSLALIGVLISIYALYGPARERSEGAGSE